MGGEGGVNGSTVLKERNKNTADLTHSSQGTNPSVVLPRQVLLVAHRAHAVCPRVAIETTASGTEHWDWALIGLLGHSGPED